VVAINSILAMFMISYKKDWEVEGASTGVDFHVDIVSGHDHFHFWVHPISGADKVLARSKISSETFSMCPNMFANCQHTECRLDIDKKVIFWFGLEYIQDRAVAGKPHDAAVKLDRNRVIDLFLAFSGSSHGGKIEYSK